MDDFREDPNGEIHFFLCVFAAERKADQRIGEILFKTERRHNM